MSDLSEGKRVGGAANCRFPCKTHGRNGPVVQDARCPLPFVFYNYLFFKELPPTLDLARGMRDIRREARCTRTGRSPVLREEHDDER